MSKYNTATEDTEAHCPLCYSATGRKDHTENYTTHTYTILITIIIINTQKTKLQKLASGIAFKCKCW